MRPMATKQTSIPCTHPHQKGACGLQLLVAGEPSILAPDLLASSRDRNQNDPCALAIGAHPAPPRCGAAECSLEQPSMPQLSQQQRTGWSMRMGQVPRKFQNPSNAKATAYARIILGGLRRATRMCQHSHACTGTWQYPHALPWHFLAENLPGFVHHHQKQSTTWLCAAAGSVEWPLCDTKCGS